jgi:hypothetical protein
MSGWRKAEIVSPFNSKELELEHLPVAVILLPRVH